MKILLLMVFILLSVVCTIVLIKTGWALPFVTGMAMGQIAYIAWDFLT